MPLDPYFTSRDHRFHPSDEMKRAWIEFLAKPYAEQKFIITDLWKRVKAGEHLEPADYHLWATNKFRRKYRQVCKIHYTVERKCQKAAREIKEGKRIYRPEIKYGLNTTGHGSKRQKHGLGHQ